MKKRNDQQTYLFIAGVVAIVAIVALVFNNAGSLEGAPVFEETEDYQKLCTDDDPQNDFYKAGTILFAKKSYADRCDGDFLVQYHCKTGTNVRPLRAYECPNGCSEGACLS
jgi:hypothetical protein